MDILLSGLGRIAANLNCYGTLRDEPLKPMLKLLQMPDVLPTLQLHQVRVYSFFILETVFMILGKPI